MALSGVVTRAVIAGGPLVAAAASGLGSELPPTWLWVLVAAFAAGHAFAPDSDLGVGAALAVAAWWGLGPAADDGVPPSVLLAALALVAAHVAAVLADYGPAPRDPDRRLVTTWVVRAALAASAAVPVWLLAVVVDGRGPAGTWETGMVVLVVASVAAAVAVSGWPARPSGPAPSGRSRRGE